MNNDLISRSALLDGLRVPLDYPSLYLIRKIVKGEPAVDAEPVRRGRWVMRGGYIRCSECDVKTLWKDTGGIGGFSHEYEQVKSKRCHECGAKMDGDADV